MIQPSFENKMNTYFPVHPYCCPNQKVAALFFAFGYALPEIGKSFSSDPQVLTLARKLSVVAGVSFLFLAIFYASMAVLEGTAW